MHFGIQKILKVGMELEFENKIKCLRIDNIGEYRSGGFDHICQ